MATIKQSYAASVSVLTLGTLASVTGILSAEVDNTINLYLSADLEITANITTATKTVDFYMVGSEDGTNFATTDNVNNLLFIGSLHLVSGVAQTKVIRVEQLPRKFKIYAYNADATALLSGSVDMTGVSLTNA